MALIKQLVRREIDEAAIEKKRKKIQAVIDANRAFKRAVDESVGAKRPKSEEAFEKARITGIRALMKKNLKFAKLIADAAKS
jgi:Na+-translocating ferredoxin:NAD+ oxidoreductase RnfG subunit